MAEKKFLYCIEAKREDGTIAQYNIYKKGGSTYIDEHLMHPSAKSIDDEIRIVFKSTVIRTIMPGMV